MKKKVSDNEKNFQKMVGVARKIMQDATSQTAFIMGDHPPLLIEKTLPDGSIRIVCRWADGSETNECVIQRRQLSSQQPDDLKGGR